MVHVHTGDRNESGAKAGNIKIILIGEHGSSGIPIPLFNPEVKSAGGDKLSE